MHRRIVLFLSPFAFVGCLSPLTQRLDEANAQAAIVNQQLAASHAQFMELKATLDRSEARLQESNRMLDEANKTFVKMERHIEDMDKYMEDMDKKFSTLDVGLRKVLGIKTPAKDNPPKDKEKGKDNDN
jgi:septal ring factor EnvC (AmiA/AmiB activator)